MLKSLTQSKYATNYYMNIFQDMIFCKKNILFIIFETNNTLEDIAQSQQKRLDIKNKKKSKIKRKVNFS